MVRYSSINLTGAGKPPHFKLSMKNIKHIDGKDRHVVKKIGQALRLVQSLEKMELSEHHAFEVQVSKGLLLGIIAYGGYRSKYHWLFGLRLLKAPASRK